MAAGPIVADVVEAGPVAAPKGRTPRAGAHGTFVSDLRALPGRVSVRLRLTLLYGLLFFFAGALLLVITYVLVGQILDSVFPDGTQVSSPVWVIEADLLKDRTMKELVGRSMLVFAGTGVMALVLGYFVADRALAPLQTVTATARRLSESTLHDRIALEGPDDEIKELADTFDAMLERLGQAFDAQRRFVNNASHELRTPLAINRTLLEVALGDPEASEDLKVVGRTLLATNARHERLIEGLLLLARSERELTTRTPVDLSELAGSVLETAAKRTSRAEGAPGGAGGRPSSGGTEDHPQVSMHTELTPGTAAGDPVLLEHLVGNLVDNAIKHNADDGQVWVRTGVLDGYATLQIENTGPMVPAYEVDRLFEPFRRLHTDRIESAKGSGLGLSIVRSVARAHRGTVYAVPRSGGGLIVTVRLPLAAS